MKRLLLSILYILIFSLLGVMLMSVIKPSTFLSTPLRTVSGSVSNLHHELLEYVNPEKPTHDHSSVYHKHFFIS